MAENLGMNASGNLNGGVYPMPSPATSSEADMAVDMRGLIKTAATGLGADDGTRRSDSPPPSGGNDGTEKDLLLGPDLQKG
jgi:hypothetical protein